MTSSNSSYYNQPFFDIPAAPTNLAANDLTAMSVIFSWIPGIGNVPVAFFALWDGTHNTWAGHTDGNSTSLRQFLSPSTHYVFSLHAVSFAGIISNSSNLVSFDTPPWSYYQLHSYPPRPVYSPYKNFNWY